MTVVDDRIQCLKPEHRAKVLYANACDLHGMALPPTADLPA